VTKLLSRLRRGHPDIDVLSACAEEDSRPNVASALAAHVAACADCRRRIEELRGIRAALRSMPSADVPRSFRLWAADVETPAHRRRPASGAGVLRLMPAMTGLAVVLFVALVGADLLSNRDSGSASRTTKTLDSAPKGAGSNAQAPVPGSPQAASKAEAGTGAAAPTAATAGALTSAPAPGDAAAPTASEGQAAPSSADTAPPPNSAAPGTFASPPPSSTETAQMYAAAQAAQPPHAPEFRDTHVAPVARNDRWSGLRIAEAIVAALAIGSGGIALSRWMRSKEVR
jgi:hypothetical protein